MSDGNTFAMLAASSEGRQELPDEVILDFCLSDDVFDSWYACKAVGALGIEAGIENLLAVLKKPAPMLDDHKTDRRLVAAWSLAKFGFDRVGKRLISAYNSGDNLTKQGCVDALGELKDLRALPLLVESIRADDYEVVLWSTLAASKLGADVALVLRDLLVEDLPESTKILIKDALQKIEAQRV